MSNQFYPSTRKLQETYGVMGQGKAQRFCIVLSDHTEPSLFGWALSTGGHYIAAEGKEDQLAEFCGRSDAVVGCQDHIRYTREESQGKRGFGLMHSIMEVEVWRSLQDIRLGTWNEN